MSSIIDVAAIVFKALEDEQKPIYHSWTTDQRHDLLYDLFGLQYPYSNIILVDKHVYRHSRNAAGLKG